jgi:hypothetical protein
MHASQLIRGIADGDERTHVHRKTGDTEGPYTAARSVSKALVDRTVADGLLEWQVNHRFNGIEELVLTNKGKTVLPFKQTVLDGF